MVQNKQQNRMLTPIAYKFVKWDVPPLDTLTNSKVYQLREKLNKGEKISRQEKDWLAQELLGNSYFNTSVPLMGYRFDFSDVVKTFLVKQYGDWHEYNAPDKTSIRNNLLGKIDKIVELK